MAGAAFEKMKSLCGGDKASANNVISNDKNVYKKLAAKKKFQIKKEKISKRNNLKSQKLSIENILHENIKNTNTALKIDATNFKDSLNMAVKLSTESQQVQNMNDEKDSINVERDHSDRVTKLNKYGVSGWMLDK